MRFSVDGQSGKSKKVHSVGGGKVKEVGVFVPHENIINILPESGGKPRNDRSEYACQSKLCHNFFGFKPREDRCGGLWLQLDNDPVSAEGGEKNVRGRIRSTPEFRVGR